MKTRVITGTVLAAVFVALCIFSEYPVYHVFMSLLCIAAVFEMLRVFGIEKNLAVGIPAYLLAAAMPTCVLFVDKLPRGHYDYYLLMALSLVVYLVYLFVLAVFMRGRLKFASVSGVFTSVFYIVASFSAFSLIRDIENGVYIFVIVFISSTVCDVFAYFTGFFFGKHKLSPEISPKKTVEGAIGGTVFATAALVLYAFVVDMVADTVSVNYILAAVYGLVLAIVGQIGDLIASFIKREYGVKDYSKLLPGHGGIMDRFDSILAVSTVLLVVCLLFPPFSLAA